MMIGCPKEERERSHSGPPWFTPFLGSFCIMAAARILEKMGRLSYRILAGSGRRSSSSSAASAGDSRTQKLERIADELLSLNKIERHDYSILYRLKLGLDRRGSAAAIAVPGVSTEGGPEEAAEKTAFDVKLEKFDAAAKIKVIKEVRTFTDLGLKEAKEMVEKAPIVLKKGVTKEEAEQILAKLKAAGAIAVLE